MIEHMLGPLKSNLVFAAHRAQGCLKDPFQSVADNLEVREQLDGLPCPQRRYVIFFTPRSGSTRLTDILNRAGGLGSPDEIFNPLHLANLAADLGAQNLPDYLNLLLRRFATGGTFGCEIAITHLYHIFFSERKFFQLLNPTSEIFLVRENIVEQAVSLSRMAQTGFSHSVPATRAHQNPQEFAYAPRQIRGRLDRVLAMERGCETIFANRELQPLRLSYELLIEKPPEEFVPVISRHVGATPEEVQGLVTVHEKISDARSEEYAQKFSKAHGRFLRRVEAERAPTLEALAVQRAGLFA
jgi:LPS sulfotransferase NodH